MVLYVCLRFHWSSLGEAGGASDICIGLYFLVFFMYFCCCKGTFCSFPFKDSSVCLSLMSFLVCGYLLCSLCDKYTMCVSYVMIIFICSSVIAGLASSTVAVSCISYIVNRRPLWGSLRTFP